LAYLATMIKYFLTLHPEIGTGCSMASRHMVPSNLAKFALHD
jgi:hypothetical protein